MIKKAEFIVFNETYRTSILCFFNMKKKEILKRIKRYKNNEEAVSILNKPIADMCSRYCLDLEDRYMLVIENFDENNLDDISCLVHETHHLTQFNLRRTNATENIEYTDIEPPAYYQEAIFKAILDKYIKHNAKSIRQDNDKSKS